MAFFFPADAMLIHQQHYGDINNRIQNIKHGFSYKQKKLNQKVQKHPAVHHIIMRPHGGDNITNTSYALFTDRFVEYTAVVFKYKSI